MRRTRFHVGGHFLQSQVNALQRPASLPALDCLGKVRHPFGQSGRCRRGGCGLFQGPPQLIGKLRERSLLCRAQLVRCLEPLGNSEAEPLLPRHRPGWWVVVALPCSRSLVAVYWKGETDRLPYCIKVFLTPIHQ